MRFKFIKCIISSIVLCGALSGCEKPVDTTPVDTTPVETTEGNKCKTHEWDDGVVTIQPTTTYEGVKTYTCKVCGEKKQKSIPKIDPSECVHTWNEGFVILEPTETSEGVKTYTCTICGTTRYEKLPKLTPVECEHTWNDGVVTKEPTADSTGIKTYTCTKCGNTKNEILDPTGPVTCEHTWDNGVVTKEATLTEEGVKTYTCTKCGNTKDEPIAKIDPSTCIHEWDEGTIIAQPTETSDGYKLFECKICNTKRTETLPKLGRKFTVTYDANGGTGSGISDLNEYESGDYVTVKSNSFTAPEGKEFINWNEAPDGSGSYHNANSRFKIYENVTLYAQWLDIEQPLDNEHNIKVIAPQGVTYRLSKTKAEEDEEITLTITVASGIALNGNPVSSQVSLTKVSDTEYKFVMPNNAVTIEIKATIDGDVVLSGDITAKLTDEDGDGIYSADVECNAKTSYDFTYVVKDNKGNPVRLSSYKLDETRCNANVTFLSSGNNELTIAGGCTYTFYYDSNSSNFNCYVVRKTVDVLPNNSNLLYSLFDGRMRSNTTVHPQGLTSISYEKRVTGTDATQGYKLTDASYVYKKISDTESFAVATDHLKANKESYVYKNIDTANNIYSIINTYTAAQGNNEASDNVWNLDPYGNSQVEGQRYLPYSAKQDIVDNGMYNDTSRYQITNREAYRNVNMAAHYSSALEYEMWMAIRGDFDGKAVINKANAEGSHCNITPYARTNGFRVILDSQLEYNFEESANATSDVTRFYAFVYNAEFVFSKNGDLRSLDYTEDFYNKDQWDYTNHRPMEDVTPITTTIEVEYKYNETFERNEVLGSFNPEDYFITSIDKLSFYNSKAGEKQNNVSVMNFDDSLKIYDYLSGGNKNEVVDEFEFTPSTALDAWQYGYIDSTNKGVADDTPYGPKTVGTGTATITFGNHLQNINGPTYSVDISVYAGGKFRSLFVNNNVQGYDSFGGPHADYLYGYAGRTMSYYIDSSQNTGCPVSYCIAFNVLKNDEGEIVYGRSSSQYFNVVNSVESVTIPGITGECAKVVGHELILDFNTEAANALTKPVTVDITMMSDFYSIDEKTGKPENPTVLHVVIGPTPAPLANSKYSATYYYENDATKKYEDAVIEFFNGGTGKITEKIYNEDGSLKYTNIFNFSYVESGNGTVNCIVTSVNCQEPGLTGNANLFKMGMERQLNGTIGVYLYYDGSEDIQEIFGIVDKDLEGFISVEYLTVFERVED